MWQTEDLIDQALNTWGTFYRVSLPIEEGFGFSATYESEDRIVASAETRTTDATFTASAAPTAPGDARLHRPPFDAPVDVYFDGVHLGTTGWHSVDGDWTAWTRVAPDVWVCVTIQGRWQTPPSTLEIVRDRP